MHLQTPSSMNPVPPFNRNPRRNLIVDVCSAENTPEFTSAPSSHTPPFCFLSSGTEPHQAFHFDQDSGFFSTQRAAPYHLQGVGKGVMVQRGHVLCCKDLVVKCSKLAVKDTESPKCLDFHWVAGRPCSRIPCSWIPAMPHSSEVRDPKELFWIGMTGHSIRFHQCQLRKMSLFCM